MSVIRGTPTCPICHGRLIRLVHGGAPDPEEHENADPERNPPRNSYRCRRCRRAFAAGDLATPSESLDQSLEGHKAALRPGHHATATGGSTGYCARQAAKPPSWAAAIVAPRPDC
jgi:hypothetical protein